MHRDHRKAAEVLGYPLHPGEQSLRANRSSISNLAAGISSPFYFGGEGGAVMEEPTLLAETEKGKGSHITIGSTIYYVNVHFGKIPLDDILRQRVIQESKRESE